MRVANLLKTLVLFSLATLALAACGAPAQPTPAVETVVMVVTATPEPLAQPTAEPAVQPTAEPAVQPTAEPAAQPTAEPSGGEYTGTVVQTNAEWTPVIEVIEGMQMALVPPGCFTMGNQAGTELEIPGHQQCVNEPYWIGVTEVTNAQYGTDGDYGPDNFPRNQVTWVDAKTFCEGLGMRLPTEVEWEYAARGPDSLTYPWGNDWVPGFSVNANNATLAAATGTLPEGASWVGALDMAGNLREWTFSVIRAYPYDGGDGREDPRGEATTNRAVRGGSHMQGRDQLRSSYREWYQQGYTAADIGFRCVKDY